MILICKHPTGFALIDLSPADMITVNRTNMAVHFPGDKDVTKINFDVELSMEEADALALYLAGMKNRDAVDELDRLLTKLRQTD